MKTRGLGRSIMAGGVVCVLTYALLAMRGATPLNVRVGGLLFYVGVVAIPLGVILLWTGEMKRPPGKYRERYEEMTIQTNISVGDTVRVRYGKHEGETATVANLTWHSNQFGSYARVQLNLEGGEVDERSMDDLEKVYNSAVIENSDDKEKGQ